MPSHSKAQHRLMEVVLHNPEIAKKTGVPLGVARDFVEADKRKGSYSEGSGRIKSASLLERCARKIV